MSPFVLSFAVACTGIVAAAWYLSLKPYRMLLVFVLMSHFLVWFLKVTCSFLPTQYVALLPSGVVGLLYLAVGLQVVNRTKSPPRICCLDFLVGGLILTYIIQMFNDYVTVTFGLRAFHRTAFFAGTYFVGRHLLISSRYAHTLVRLIAITVALGAIIGILETVFDIPLQGGYRDLVLEDSGINALRLSERRSVGTLTSCAAFGVMSCIGVLCAFVWLVSSRNRGWFLSSSSLMASAFGVVISGSRSSIIAVFLGLLTGIGLLAGAGCLASGLLTQLRKKALHITLALTITLSVMIMGVILIETPLTDNVLRRVSTISPEAFLSGEVLHDRNLVARKIVWGAVWSNITQRPFLGYGTGILGGGSHREGVRFVRGHATVDNQYLQLWGELGILGLLLYCGIISAALVHGRSARHNPEARILGVLVVAVAAMFAVAGLGSPPLDMYPANAFFWLILGMSPNLKRYRRLSTEAANS